MNNMHTKKEDHFEHDKKAIFLIAMEIVPLIAGAGRGHTDIDDGSV